MRPLWIISAAILTSAAMTAASPVAQKFVGSWKLISYQFTNAAGEVSFPFGREVTGRLTYEPAGRMSVQIMQAGRPRGDGTVWSRGTPEQIVPAYRGYTAYFGTYTVDEARVVVIHKVEGSLFPNYLGTEQQRRYTFSGNHLTLEGDMEHGRTRLVWERLP
jgi:hypothetical protein